MTQSTIATIADPGISDEECACILGTLPKCPTCGSAIARVQFLAFETHRFFTEVDGTDGSVLAYSTPYETLRVKPELDSERAHVMVECEKKHIWAEPRLRLTRQDSTGEDWEILPPPPYDHMVNAESQS